jgi:16S rRNA (guanine1207-N2)-methyltransferase
MRVDRLRLALTQGLLRLPDTGRVLVVNPGGADDMSALPAGRLALVQGFRTDHDALAARGFAVTPDLPEGPFGAALVCLPRSREAGLDLIAQAAARVAPGGPVAVDGQKTNGIDATLRLLRPRVALTEPLAKAHGKLAVFAAGPGLPDRPDLSDWLAAPRNLPGGLVTRPGVFSAEGADRGSAALVAALPARLPGRGVDLGAGWGFLAAAALAREGVQHLDLVEADHAALACARAGIADPRAAFHWADALAFRPARPADWVLLNPPFHAGRTADPGLGQRFIRAAAGMLAPGGTLWLVANRPLPYAETLATLFREVEETGGDTAFRVTRATAPRPQRKTEGP